jgi:hypothetical protein
VFFGTTRIARRVICQALEDLTDLDTDTRQDAIRWVGSQDFDHACMEAQLDSHQIKKFIAQMMKLPTGIRRKKARQLINKYLD